MRPSSRCKEKVDASQSSSKYALKSYNFSPLRSRDGGRSPNKRSLPRLGLHHIKHLSKSLCELRTDRPGTNSPNTGRRSMMASELTNQLHIHNTVETLSRDKHNVSTTSSITTVPESSFLGTKSSTTLVKSALPQQNTWLSHHRLSSQKGKIPKRNEWKKQSLSVALRPHLLHKLRKPTSTSHHVDPSKHGSKQIERVSNKLNFHGSNMENIQESHTASTSIHENTLTSKDDMNQATSKQPRLGQLFSTPLDTHRVHQGDTRIEDASVGNVFEMAVSIPTTNQTKTSVDTNTAVDTNTSEVTTAPQDDITIDAIPQPSHDPTNTQSDPKTNIPSTSVKELRPRFQIHIGNTTSVEDNYLLANDSWDSTESSNLDYFAASSSAQQIPMNTVQDTMEAVAGRRLRDYSELSFSQVRRIGAHPYPHIRAGKLRTASVEHRGTDVSPLAHSRRRSMTASDLEHSSVHQFSVYPQDSFEQSSTWFGVDYEEGSTRPIARVSFLKPTTLRRRSVSLEAISPPRSNTQSTVASTLIDNGKAATPQSTLELSPTVQAISELSICHLSDTQKTQTSLSKHNDNLVHSISIAETNIETQKTQIRSSSHNDSLVHSISIAETNVISVPSSSEINVTSIYVQDELEGPSVSVNNSPDSRATQPERPISRFSLNKLRAKPSASNMTETSHTKLDLSQSYSNRPTTQFQGRSIDPYFRGSDELNRRKKSSYQPRRRPNTVCAIKKSSGRQSRVKAMRHAQSIREQFAAKQAAKSYTNAFETRKFIGEYLSLYKSTIETHNKLDSSLATPSLEQARELYEEHIESMATSRRHDVHNEINKIQTKQSYDSIPLTIQEVVSPVRTTTAPLYPKHPTQESKARFENTFEDNQSSNRSIYTDNDQNISIDFLPKDLMTRIAKLSAPSQETIRKVHFENNSQDIKRQTLQHEKYIFHRIPSQSTVQVMTEDNSIKQQVSISSSPARNAENSLIRSPFMLASSQLQESKEIRSAASRLIALKRWEMLRHIVLGLEPNASTRTKDSPSNGKDKLNKFNHQTIQSRSLDNTCSVRSKSTTELRRDGTSLSTTKRHHKKNYSNSVFKRQEHEKIDDKKHKNLPAFVSQDLLLQKLGTSQSEYDKLWIRNVLREGDSRNSTLTGFLPVVGFDGPSISEKEQQSNVIDEMWQISADAKTTHSEMKRTQNITSSPVRTNTNRSVNRTSSACQTQIQDSLLSTSLPDLRRKLGLHPYVRKSQKQ